MHSVADVLPAAEIKPFEQLAHTVERDVSEDVAPAIAYLPAAQSVMVPEQVLEVKPSVSPYVPAGQGVHAPAPVDDLYEPLVHAVQLAPV